ncbi:hypothetical protein GLOIN_2v1788213 [Rhizophagus clarus]|uniref:Uncharacterized protein n=1 Tax=Rhizophagus clarus TaxID=94130 RepID=A0A8H3QRS5_9GLOM|nr:hypothetical protein GLOIN_2v1788213 [Rhizophagus clarus]
MQFLQFCKKRGIFDDIQKLVEVLFPIKDAILSLKRNNANLADCYINLLQVVASIKKMDQNDYKVMTNIFTYVTIGILVTPSEFDNLIELAGELWKEWGHKRNSIIEIQNCIPKLENIV